jgi:hypothetical protein
MNFASRDLRAEKLNRASQKHVEKPEPRVTNSVEQM